MKASTITGPVAAIQASALRGLLLDFICALEQQMFFWGRDVVHRGGNLLVAHGFDRRPSEGLDGTSCYRLGFQGATIELHGACVGRYSSASDGFLFVRNRKRCFRCTSGKPPLPGTYTAEFLHVGPPADLFSASRRFLRWWLRYESWISEASEPGYREACFRAYCRLPRSRPWLPPQQALNWLGAYANDEPGPLRRAREWRHDYAAVLPS